MFVCLWYTYTVNDTAFSNARHHSFSVFRAHCCIQAHALRASPFYPLSSHLLIQRAVLPLSIKTWHTIDAFLKILTPFRHCFHLECRLHISASFGKSVSFYFHQPYLHSSSQLTIILIGGLSYQRTYLKCAYENRPLSGTQTMLPRSSRS